MKIFSTRETAIIIWIAISIIWVLFLPKIRNSLFNVVKVFFSKQLIKVNLLALLYIGCAVYLLYRIDFWDKLLLKRTIFWTLTIASVTLFKINKVSEGNRFFSEELKRYVKFSLVFEFILDFYSLNLFLELLIVPLTVIIGALIAFADLDNKYQSVKRFLTNVAMLFGLFYIVLALYHLCTHLTNFTTIDNAKDFLLNPILSIMFLPFIYLLSIYMDYEVAFVGLNNVFNNSELCGFAKRHALLKFNFNIEGLKRWKTQVFRDDVKSKTDIITSIQSIVDLQKIEKNPPPVDSNFGWSPYASKDFLLKDGIKTGFYSGNNDDWFAYGLKKLNDSIFTNNITYSIIGNNAIVKNLELALDVHYNEDAQNARMIFLQHAKTLYQHALSKNLPIKIETAILKCRNETIKDNEIIVSVEKHDWKNKNNWYTITFKIQHAT